MDKILFINACVRPCSRTRQLAESVLKKLDGPVEEVCLDGTTLSALGLEGIEKREQASQKPLHCKLEGKRRSTTKIVVTQDFSPALDSSTTGRYQGLILHKHSAPARKSRGIFSMRPFATAVTVYPGSPRTMMMGILYENE